MSELIDTLKQLLESGDFTVEIRFRRGSGEPPAPPKNKRHQVTCEACGWFQNYATSFTADRGLMTHHRHCAKWQLQHKTAKPEDPDFNRPVNPPVSGKAPYKIPDWVQYSKPIVRGKKGEVEEVEDYADPEDPDFNRPVNSPVVPPVIAKAPYKLPDWLKEATPIVRGKMGDLEEAEDKS